MLAGFRSRCTIAGGMGRLESLDDLNNEPEGLVCGQSARLEPLLQRLPVDVLHGDERLAVDLANFVDLANVRVVEGGGGLGLAQEAMLGGGVGFEVFGKELQGDVALEHRVASEVHLTHAAGADLANDLVACRVAGARGRFRRVRHRPPSGSSQ